MTPFLNCNIWSITTQSYDNFYMVEKVYAYNSVCDTINNTHTENCYQIPEFEIDNIDLLNGVNYDIINRQRIPIIRRSETDDWEINLLHYNEYIKTNNM